MLGDIWERLIGDLWFQLTLLLTVAIASGFLFARFRQPKIIGQIVLGIVIGPSVLGLITVNQDNPGDMVHRLAQLGAIILLFMIGLEYDFREIYSRKSILIATGGVIVPWIGGFLLAETMLPQPGAGFDKFSQSVFIGAAIVATSLAITAGFLREMKLLGTQVAKIMLGAAVVDDVLGMIVLAISKGATGQGGVNLDNLVWLILIAVAFVSLGAYIGARFIAKFIASVQRRGAERGIEESGFLLALSLAFLYSVVGEFIGISAIVGAFVAGTSFARYEFRSGFRKQVAVLEWVFAPIFFLSLGIIVDLREMSINAWIFALVLTVVAFVTKLVGCGIPARLLGISGRDSISIGIGMSPRMEVAMIIGLYGLTIGVVTREIYSVIVTMGLLTSLFTPTVLRRTMRDVLEGSEAQVVD